jgi:hypothetical protein
MNLKLKQDNSRQKTISTEQNLDPIQMPVDPDPDPGEGRIKAIERFGPLVEPDPGSRRPIQIRGRIRILDIRKKCGIYPSLLQILFS